MPDALCPVEAGQLIAVAECDYRYGGSGVLRLWVDAVGDPYRWHDLDWWQEVQGRIRSMDGRRLGVRSAQVRLRGVRLMQVGFAEEDPPPGS